MKPVSFVVTNMETSKYHSCWKEYPAKRWLFAKVTGQEIFTSDFILPRMLYARVLRSPHPHAKIKSIDTKAAERTGAICITSEISRR